MGNEKEKVGTGCKECGSPHIVNKWYRLCEKCNNIRLHGSEYGKQHKVSPKQRKPLKSTKMPIKMGLSKKALSVIKKDEEVYEKVFNSSNHRCEECHTQLNTEFRDDEGRVIMRARYSHILPKGAYPQLRHNEDNFNNLCPTCHHRYEFGDKENMKIFKKNEEIVCRLRKLL